jgi:hypothetical protein
LKPGWFRFCRADTCLEEEEAVGGALESDGQGQMTAPPVVLGETKTKNNNIRSTMECKIADQMDDA